MMTLPRAETLLPELMEFTQHLSKSRQDGTINDWDKFGAEVRAFFTPTMMAKTEEAVLGWGQMAKYAEEQTLIHVTSVLTAMHLLPEYQQASPEEQQQIEWTVLFHDVAKIPKRGKHDYIHGFRSAATAGRGLARVGFPVTAGYAGYIDEWATLTHNAILYHNGFREIIQDNGKLPEILAGIDCLFGANTPAVAIIKGVLLHMSIVNDPGYPTLAPLTDAEIHKYLDPKAFPILKMMMLVDTDGWDFFDPESRAYHRRITLEVFDKIAAQIGV